MNQYLLNWKPVLTIFLLLVSTWVIAEQSPISGSKIQISGVPTDIKTNIELYLGVENAVISYSRLGFPHSKNYILSKSKLALQALGYYKPKISLAEENQVWNLSIQLNQPTKWQHIEIQLQGSGMNSVPLIQLTKQHPFLLGTTVNHDIYEQYKNQLLKLAHEAGFLDVQFEISRMDIDIENSTANVKWLINTGEVYHIGEVELQGSNLSSTFLQRYVFIKPDDVYQQENIIKSQQLLNRSGYFNLVTIEQIINQQQHKVNITIALADVEKYEFKTTFGYGTDTGGKLGISWLDRRVNDSGHNYLISLDVSNIETITSIQYKIPLDKEKSEWLNRLSNQIIDDKLALSNVTKFDSRLLNHIDDNWSSQWALTLAVEDHSSNDNIVSNLKYLVPSWQTNYNSVTDPFSAQTGWRWQNEIHFSTQQISNPDIDFVQIEQKVKSIWALTTNIRLLFRGHAGYTLMDDEQFNTSMPTNYRYFTGGDVSVRGYAYQSLAPKDIDGEFLGGKHLLVSSLEVDWQFTENWRWAIFTDQGNAFNDWQHKDIHKSVGTGIRWVTPVGSIRFDLAKALDGPEDLIWHITIGPDL